jgi:dephospho-CoA kinase
MIVFDSCVFSRSINTENPRRHWKAFEISNPAEIAVSDRFPIVRAWLADVDRQFIASGYALTAAPFLVEATKDEYETQILAGETPRNVLLRVERVRKDAGRPDPLARV